MNEIVCRYCGGVVAAHWQVFQHVSCQAPRTEIHWPPEELKRLAALATQVKAPTDWLKRPRR